MRHRTSMILLAAATLHSSGCYATWDISPREVGKLDGYRVPERVELRAETGERFKFYEGTSLDFHDGDGEREYAEIRIRDGRLTGKDERGELIRAVDLASTSQVRVKRMSTGGTVGLVVGVSAGALTVGGVVAVVVMLKNWNMGWGGSSWSGIGAGIGAAPPTPRR